MQLEQDYKRLLAENFGVRFDRLLTITNQPIARFGSTLISKGQFRDYMALLRSAHRPENLPGVMCRSLVSVDWQGGLHDCDFNQMLGMPLRADGRRGADLHLRDLLVRDLAGQPDRRRRPLLRLHRGPGFLLQRSAGGMSGRPLEALTPSRRDAVCPGELWLRAFGVRAARAISRPTCCTSPEACTATCPRCSSSSAWPPSSARTVRLVFNGDYHWFDAAPADFARGRTRA